MAITQAQADKNWQDSPSTTTPILAADLKAVSKTNRDARWMVPSGVTSIDEFDDDTLDPAWVRVDSTGSPAANATWIEKGDHISLANLGGDTSGAVRGLMRPLAPFGGDLAVGDAIVTSMRLFGPNANFMMGGLMLSDGVTPGAGKQLAAMFYGQPSLVYNMWVGTNWVFSNQNTDLLVQATEAFTRLVRVSATTWRHDVSPDGVSWLLGGVQTMTITPTHVGFGSSSWGTFTKCVIRYEFLRRVSGVS